MPYVSNAQRRKFHAMLNRGEMDKSTVAEYDSASKGMKLPERVSPAARKRAAMKRKRKGK